MKSEWNEKIVPFLWFDHQAEEAAKFYTSLFNDTAVTATNRYSKSGAQAAHMQEGSVMTVSFRIEGQEFVALNGGPVFSIGPAISFFVHCITLERIQSLWNQLAQGGKVRMQLGKYPFSEQYGWVEDRFGVSWQLILGDRPQKIVPCLMFTGDQHGRAEEALQYYVSVFRNSGIQQMERYTADQGPEGLVVHGRFTLNQQEFIVMDSHQKLPYAFNPAVSFLINCDSQDEIDYYWEKLSAGGDERAQQCGWLGDRFGVSWQVVPAAWKEMQRKAAPNTYDKLMQAILQMKKFDLQTIQEVYAS